MRIRKSWSRVEKIFTDLDKDGRPLAHVISVSPGMYAMSTRADTSELLEQFGDAIFDGRGGSGRT